MKGTGLLGTRRRKLVAVVVVLLAGPSLAWAYWSSLGTGSGSAGTGSAQAVTIAQTATVSSLYPGGPAQGLDFKITNPAPGSQRVATVQVSIVSVSKAAGAAAGDCDASDFAVAQPATAVNQDLPSGDTTFTGTKAPTLRMVNKASNQDACQGATVDLAFAAS